MELRIWLFGALAGCATPSMIGEVSAGWAHPVGDSLADEGTELRAAFAAGAPGEDFGAGIDVTYRHAGITQELALGIHHYWLTALAQDVTGFARIGANLIEWDRVGIDDGAGLGGPSFELGIAARKHGGPCLVVSAARDFRFNDPDDTFLGVSVGLCALVSASRGRVR